MIASGVSWRASTPITLTKSKPGMTSATGGNSGKIGERPRPLLASSLMRPLSTPALRLGYERPQHLDVTAEQRRHRLTGPSVGNVSDIKILSADFTASMVR